MADLDKEAERSAGKFETEANDPFRGEYEAARELVFKDDDLGIKIIEDLAKKGSILSILYIADSIRTGWKYEKDVRRSIEWYELAERLGSVRGSYGLGTAYKELKDTDSAISSLSKILDEEYPPAMNIMATILFYHKADQDSQRLAISLWEKGSRFDHYYSRRNLGIVLMRGGGGFWRVPEGFATWVCSIFQVKMTFRKYKYSYRFR